MEKYSLLSTMAELGQWHILAGTGEGEGADGGSCIIRKWENFDIKTDYDS